MQHKLTDEPPVPRNVPSCTAPIPQVGAALPSGPREVVVVPVGAVVVGSVVVVPVGVAVVVPVGVVVVVPVGVGVPPPITPLPPRVKRSVGAVVVAVGGVSGAPDLPDCISVRPCTAREAIKAWEAWEQVPLSEVVWYAHMVPPVARMQVHTCKQVWSNANMCVAPCQAVKLYVSMKAELAKCQGGVSPAWPDHSGRTHRRGRAPCGRGSGSAATSGLQVQVQGGQWEEKHGQQAGSALSGGLADRKRFETGSSQLCMHRQTGALREAFGNADVWGREASRHRMAAARF